MNCHLHVDAPASSTCADCGSALCPACARSVAGAAYCERCLGERVTRTGPPGAATPLKSPGLALALSIPIPGLGQVYNGYVARGIAQFAAFFFLVWFSGQDPGAEGLIVLCAVVGWVWQFLDARLSAIAINRTGRLPDAEEARALGKLPLAALDPGSRPLGVALVVIGAVVLLGNFSLAGVAARVLVPLALVAAGVWLVLRAKRERETLRSQRDEAPPAGPPVGPA